MIELYRPVDCLTCIDIEVALKEMVVAHKIMIVSEDDTPDCLPANTPLPALKDNGEIITGQPAITAHLKELEEFVAEWRRFQSDACYIDDDGETC